jgi:hypothetical protein
MGKPMATLRLLSTLFSCLVRSIPTASRTALVIGNAEYHTPSRSPIL